MTEKDAGKSYAAFSQQLWEGDYDKALKSIDSAIAIDPDPSLLIVKGVFLFELGRTGGEKAGMGKVSNYAEILLRFKPPPPSGKQDGRYSKALAVFEGLLEKEPDHYYHLNNKGAVLVELKKYAEAEAAFMKAIEVEPFMTDSRFNLGICLARQGKNAEGLHEIEDAIWLKPFTPLFQVEYAKVCASEGSVEKGANMVTGYLGQMAWYRSRLAEMVEEELKGELTAKEREVFGRIQIKLPDGDPWIE